MRRNVERVWYGEGWSERLARAVLAPAGWSYAAVVAARNALYDHGLLRSRPAAIPALSLGNLTVGGTGKTPIAAWAAARLATAGARPAVVLRGYGDDESLVHARLNPGLVVVTDADRVRGVARARELGADCAILDDGFQHRRIRRCVWVNSVCVTGRLRRHLLDALRHGRHRVGRPVRRRAGPDHGEDRGDFISSCHAGRFHNERAR